MEGVGEEKTASRSRLICPVCGGGSSKERSYSLTTDSAGNSFGMCFRNSCGHTEKNGKVSMIVDRPPVHSPKLLPLGEDLKNVLDSYGVNYEGFHETECGFLHHFIKDIIGRTYGFALKGWHPKYNRTRFERANEGAWVGGGDKCVIVEDYLSACRIAQTGNLRGCSLSGTIMTEPLVKAIKNLDVVVALDKDAWLSSLKIVDRLQGWCKSVKAIPLEKDIKNMTENELQDLVVTL